MNKLTNIINQQTHGIAILPGGDNDKVVIAWIHVYHYHIDYIKITIDEAPPTY